jgi:polyhydroxyalkanoate synthesis regulator phasin
MNISEFIKKSVAFSVGAAAFSAEKLKQFSDDMVARGEMTSEEAKSFVDDMTQKAEDEKKSLQDWMRDQMSRMLQQAGAAEASRVDMLERRITVLEKRLAQLSPETEELEDESGVCCTVDDESLPTATAD